MTRHAHKLIGLLTVCLLAGAIGCEDPKAEIDRLEQELADKNLELQRIPELERRLRDAENRLVGADESTLGLRNEIDRLKNELAAAQAAKAEGWQTVPGGALINIESQVLFDAGIAALKDTGKQSLDAVASAIKQKYADHDIYIFGHTDNQPIKESGWKDNYELSCQRALTVVRYLRSRGITQYTAACGWGEHRPIESNATATGQQANRRVQIFAYKPEASQ